MFHIFGSLGQFERDLIRERTNAGLARARQFIAVGLTVRKAAARVKVGKSALYAALKANAAIYGADK